MIDESLMERWQSVIQTLQDFGWEQGSVSALAHLSLSHVLAKIGRLEESAENYRKHLDALGDGKWTYWVAGMYIWTQWLWCQMHQECWI